MAGSALPQSQDLLRTSRRTGADHGVGRHRAQKSVRHQFYLLSSGRLGGAALQAVLLGLAARWSGPTDFGLLASVLGATQAAMALADLGLSPTLVRLRARSPQDPRIRRLLEFNAQSSVVLGAVIVITLACLGFAYDQPHLWLLIGIGVWAVGEKNTETWLTISLADGRTDETLRSLITRRGAAVLSFLFLSTLGMGVLLSYSLALAASGTLGATLIRRTVSRRLPAAQRQVRASLGSAIPLWLTSVAVQARTLDVATVRLVADGVAAGIYAAPIRMVGPLNMLPSALSQIVLPYAARKDAANLRILLKGLLVIMSVMIVLYAVIGALAEPLVGILGPGFATSAGPLRVILVGMIFFGVSTVLTSLLQGLQDDRSVALITLSMTATCLIAVAAGARTFGATGAAVGFSASCAAQLALLTARTWRVHWTRNTPAEG